MKYDIAIIGGGPAGYNAAEKAAVNGFKTILFEKEFIGGVCLNIGCIPSKTLLYSAKLLDSTKSAAKYGINVEGTTSFNLEKIISRKDKTIKKLTGGVKMKLTSNGVEIVEGEAILTDEKDGSFQITCGKQLYTATHILLCTGSSTVIPPIKGLSEIDYWTSREALEVKALPKTLAIIGGGVIGLELASFFNSMGVKVSVIEMMPEILGAMDNEISAMLRAEYKKKGIAFFLDTKVTEVNSQEVIVEKKSKISTIAAERILISVGRKANINNIGLEHFKLEMLKNGIKVNEYMQTSHPRIYACGDITGYSMLAHTAIREGEVAINHILGLDDKMTYDAIPAVVYTNPEFAGVGVTEAELKAQGIQHRTLKLPMTYSGRFMAENEALNGMCKLIIDADEHIIGCHMLGNPASEMIVIAGMAIEQQLTVDEFKKNVFPHPTVAEIIHELLNV